MPIFDNFFSKWSQMKTNEDKGMKPTLKGHNYTKFSYRERSSLLSHSSLEYMYFKGRTEVEVGDLIFCREIFPYLESSLVRRTNGRVRTCLALHPHNTIHCFNVTNVKNFPFGLNLSLLEVYNGKKEVGLETFNWIIAAIAMCKFTTHNCVVVMRPLTQSRRKLDLEQMIQIQLV